jgi:hypothetical protein
MTSLCAYNKAVEEPRKTAGLRESRVPPQRFNTYVDPSLRVWGGALPTSRISSLTHRGEVTVHNIRRYYGTFGI